MNLSERKRAEKYAIERYTATKRQLELIPPADPPPAVKRALDKIHAQIQIIRDAGWRVSGDNFYNIKSLKLIPGDEIEKERNQRIRDRDQAYEAKRDALIARIWDGDLTFADIEREMRP